MLRIILIGLFLAGTFTQVFADHKTPLTDIIVYDVESDYLALESGYYLVKLSEQPLGTFELSTREFFDKGTSVKPEWLTFTTDNWNLMQEIHSTHGDIALRPIISCRFWIYGHESDNFLKFGTEMFEVEQTISARGMNITQENCTAVFDARAAEKLQVWIFLLISGVLIIGLYVYSTRPTQKMT